MKTVGSLTCNLNSYRKIFVLVATIILWYSADQLCAYILLYYKDYFNITWI